MPTVPQIIHIRRSRDRKAARSPAKKIGRLGFAAGCLLSLLAALSAIGLSIAYANLTADLPSPQSLPALLEPPNGLLLQPTRLFDRSGEYLILALENPASAGRQYLPLQAAQASHLEAFLVNATLAAADPDFWDHPGFSLRGTLAEDPKSLAERLVADLLLWNEPPGIRRALRERLLAAQITKEFGKEKVLEWYLNSADYGNLAFGADAAARAYLGKSATGLSLAEAALLAGVSQAPALNPWDAPDAAQERGQELLDKMQQGGLISPGEYRQASREKIIIKPEPVRSHLAPAFTDLAVSELSGYINPLRLFRGGLEVITTLDYDLQQQAACAAAVQIARLESSTPGEVLSPASDVCQAARLLPIISTSQEISAELSANVVVLDPMNGQILALVGESVPGLNPARPPGHPPGTLLTPFIYLAAFTRGWNPASLAWDIPANQPEARLDLQNLEESFHGPARLRTALANDYIAPAVQLLEQIGAEQVWTIARQLGISSLENVSGANASQLPLAGAEITLLEATQAYGVFANGGMLAGRLPRGAAGNESGTGLQAMTVLRITGSDGKVWLDCFDLLAGCRFQVRPVLSPQLAYLMNHVLSDEPARWPSLGHPNPLEIGRTAGAKLGHTQAGGDAWTVGYTPDLVTGVWLGERDATSEARLVPNLAAGLWRAVMQYAASGRPVRGWETPPGISQVQVCDPSGLLPNGYCPVIVNEVFLSGNEPTHEDTLFRSYQVNRATGHLATIFTPAELVEERVYMVVPPEAKEWASVAELLSPPQAYDLIAAPGTSEEGAQIRAPEMFARVRGRVSIQGQASGSGFQFYRVQVGPGLNPRAWYQLGEDIESPVTDGQLAVWDTAGLTGLFTVQLLVVKQDQQVAVSTLQVTVDNQPPEVAIRYPVPGELLAEVDESTVTFQAEAGDDLELGTVEFYLDGKLLGALKALPFALPWESSQGVHRLRVRAVDSAGNTAEVEVEFFVE